MKNECSAPECKRPVNARGLCGLHYRHAQIAGLFGTKCSVDGCSKHCVGKGLCSTHYRRVHNANNREKINERQRAYLKKWRVEREDKAKRAARGERFRKNNLSRFADKERIRRGKIKSGGGSYSREDWLRLLNRHGGACAYCGSKEKITADHVIPIARGGSNFIGNILPACISCNCSKQDKLLIEWRKNHVKRS